MKQCVNLLILLLCSVSLAWGQPVPTNNGSGTPTLDGVYKDSKKERNQLKESVKASDKYLEDRQVLQTLDCALLMKVDDSLRVIEDSYEFLFLRLSDIEQRTPSTEEHFKKAKKNLGIIVKNLKKEGLETISTLRLIQFLVISMDFTYLDNDIPLSILQQRVSNLQELHKHATGVLTYLHAWQDSLQTFENEFMKLGYQNQGDLHLDYMKHRKAEFIKGLDSVKTLYKSNKVNELVNSVLTDKQLDKFARITRKVAKSQKKLKDLQQEKATLLAEWDAKRTADARPDPARDRSYKDKKDRLNVRIFDEAKNFETYSKELSSWRSEKINSSLRAPYKSLKQQVLAVCPQCPEEGKKSKSSDKKEKADYTKKVQASPTQIGE